MYILYYNEKVCQKQGLFSFGCIMKNVKFSSKFKQITFQKSLFPHVKSTEAASEATENALLFLTREHRNKTSTVCWGNLVLHMY